MLCVYVFKTFKNSNDEAKKFDGHCEIRKIKRGKRKHWLKIIIIIFKLLFYGRKYLTYSCILCYIISVL